MEVKLRLFFDDAFNSSVGDDPHQSHADEYDVRNCGRHERKNNCQKIKGRRDLAFEIVAQCFGEQRICAVCSNDGFLKQKVSDCRHKQKGAVKRCRYCGAAAAA